MQTDCIVVPCYNEADRLDRQAFLAFLEEYPGYSLCLVDDGSRDMTLEVLRSIADEFPDRVEVLANPQNLGKAGSVRRGMLSSLARDHEYVGFLDADLATPFSEIPRITVLMYTQYQAEVGFGSRVMRMGADIARKRTRHYFGRLFSTVTHYALDVRCYDSQCGAKVFHRNTIRTLFTEPFVSPWFFDLELVIRAKASGYGLVEIPLKQWHEVSDSRLKTSDFLSTPYHIWKIRRHYFQRQLRKKI